MRTKNLSTLLAFLLITALVCTSFIGCSRGGGSSGGGGGGTTAEDPIIIKWAHTDTEAKSNSVAALEFKEYMESKTNGRVIVEVYPNAQLGDDEEILKGIKLGTIEIYAGQGVTGMVAGEQANLSELPFVYTSYEDWRIGTFEKGGIDIFNKMLEGTGLVCVDFQYAGAKHILSSKGFYKELGDLSGFKVRVTPTDLNIAIWQALGANPTPISYGEVYTALSQGVVDGIEHSLGILLDGKFYESCKYLTLTNHTFSPYVIISNAKFVDSLPADIREIFDAGIKHVGDAQRIKEVAQQEQYVQDLIDFGCEVYVMEEHVLEQMKAAMESVYEYQAKASGRDTIDAWLATGGN